MVLLRSGEQQGWRLSTGSADRWTTGGNSRSMQPNIRALLADATRPSLYVVDRCLSAGSVPLFFPSRRQPALCPCRGSCCGTPSERYATDFVLNDRVQVTSTAYSSSVESTGGTPRPCWRTTCRFLHRRTIAAIYFPPNNGPASTRPVHRRLVCCRCRRGGCRDAPSQAARRGGHTGTAATRGSYRRRRENK